MSASLTVREVAVAAKGPIGNLGGAWMSGPEEEAATAAAGLEGWQLYFLGRHGVLGDVDADVVLAAAYVFPADHLRHEWEAARQKLTAAEGLVKYLALCHTWGDDQLADFAGAGRLSDLGQAVIDGSDVVSLPLFAGWRAVSVPASAGARCAHVCQVLREHRGACHGVALAALQLDPLLAILTNAGGEANAIEYGWQPPFPTPTDDDRALRDRAEELTDDLVAPAYASLGSSERSEFLELLQAAQAHSLGA